MVSSSIAPVKTGLDHLTYTVWSSVSDLKQFETVGCNWVELVARIKTPKSHASKAACPLLKLASFGDRANAKGSLRWDDNVDMIYGIEGDYDANEVTPAEGARRLRDAGVKAVIYTSATDGVVCKKNPEGGPRWRVLAPLLRPVPVSMRHELTSLLNGALGGILGAESWVLSQTYYFGKVKGVAYEAHDVDGLTLDLHAALGEIEPIDAPVTERKNVKLAKPRRKGDADSAEIAHLRSRRLITADRLDGAVDVLCPRWEMHTTEGATSGSTWFPAGVGGRVDGGFECRHTSCGKPTTSEFRAWSGLDKIVSERVRREFEVQAPATKVQADGSVVEVQPLPALVRDKRGAIEATVSNAIKIMGRPDMTGAVVRFDTFIGEIMVSEADGSTRRFVDEDLTAIRGRLEDADVKTVAKEVARDALYVAARNNTFDSAQDWLVGIVWDRRPRIDTALTRYYGSADTPYTRAVSAYLWTALAGRVVDPGCKADMVPVFIGGQGAKKSSAVAALAPREEFAGEMSLDKIDQTDTSRLMRGKVVIELAELKGLASRDAESIKAFVSRRHEEWVEKFRTFGTRAPRRFLFIGTSNNDEILSDPTGERRWLPVHTGQADLDALVADRDQLWAEGRERFKAAGVAWKEAETLALQEHGKFKISDAWEEPIAAWLERDGWEGAPRGEGSFTVFDVMVGALDLKPVAQVKTAQMRVGNILRDLGYARRVVWIDGRTERRWQKVPE